MSSSNIIQVVFAIFLVLLLSFVAYVVYNREILNGMTSNNLQKETEIFDGILDFNSSNYEFDTFDAMASSYKNLTPSVNQQGGAEYSYNFWVYIDRNKFHSSNDIILFMRGNKTKVPYINTSNCILQKKGEYYLVKNPLVRLSKDGSSLIVEYNTITNPDANREYGKNIVDCASRNTFDNNKGLLGIYDLDKTSVYDKKWFMVTIILKESNPGGDILYKNKTTCKMYMNGSLILDRNTESSYNSSYGSTTMRHNRGKLFVNLNDEKIGNPDTFKMANLSYFNYALTEKDIIALFNKKFTKSTATVRSDGEDDNQYHISRIDENSLPKPF